MCQCCGHNFYVLKLIIACAGPVLDVIVPLSCKSSDTFSVIHIIKTNTHWAGRFWGPCLQYVYCVAWG